MTPVAHVSAHIVTVQPSLEAMPYATVTLELANLEERALAITGYRIAWTSGAFEQDRASIALGARETRRYVVRVSASAGDIAELLRDPTAARVEITRVTL